MEATPGGKLGTLTLLAVVADTFPDRAFVVLVSPKTAAAFPDADAAKFESAPNR